MYYGYESRGIHNMLFLYIETTQIHKWLWFPSQLPTDVNAVFYACCIEAKWLPVDLEDKDGVVEQN